MTTKTLEDLLTEHTLFRELDPTHVELLAGCGRNVVFEPGAVLCREGDAADSFYLIRHGRVALELTVPGRGTLVVETLERDDVLGWSWIVPPYRWRFDAVAASLIRAVSFDGACMRGKFDADPRLGYELLLRFVGLMEERLRLARVRLLDLYGHGAR